VGARLDENPELFFTLRGVDMGQLITAASATATAPIAGATAPDKALAGADLSEIFGVEIERATPAIPEVTAPATAPKKRSPKKTKLTRPVRLPASQARKQPAALKSKPRRAGKTKR
jgi:uncharacterized Zn finger protein